MSQEENPAHPDDIEEDQQSSDDWEHITPQDEGFSVESQREEPTYTELVPVPVSQNDISRSSQRSTSSQYQSHDESIGDLSGLIDECLKATDSGVLKENSGDAESFSAFDMSSKSHSNEESQTSEDESPQASYHELFRAPVMDALQQTG